MFDQFARDLLSAVESAAARMRTISPEDAAVKPAPGKWSKKEILGHLIDSASNNQHKWVRAQEAEARFEFPPYEQDHWVAAQDYQNGDWLEMIELWRLYNRQLARVAARIRADKLPIPCRINPDQDFTLEDIVIDYPKHMLHLLRQIGAG